MNFGFSMVFFAVWPGGRRCANCRDAHFLRGTVMKASSHEKHSKQQWKKQKKSSDPWARSGRGLAGDMGLNFLFFWFFHGFLQFGQKPREHKKKVQTHGQGLGYPHTNQKNKKPKNQETKKPKKPRLHTPRGGGQMQSVGSCLFVFFVFFVFLFFLVCVWIAIADVPSRDCQALSVVALEARSIHYSTAMFAMT